MGVSVAFGIASGICIGLCCLAGITTIIVGAVHASTKDDKYVELNCTIIDNDMKTKTCKTERCSGTTSTRHCYYDDYRCCQKWWRVSYTLDAGNSTSMVETDKMETSYTRDCTESRTRVAGTTHTCWYHDGNVYWNKPDPNNMFMGTMITMSFTIFFLIFAVSLAITAIVTGLITHFN